MQVFIEFATSMIACIRSNLAINFQDVQACFLLYLKIINKFLKNKLCILLKIIQRTQKIALKF